MNIAITGGTGFLGSALVDALVARGDAVRALTRRPAGAAHLRTLGAEPVIGDLADVERCRELVSGGDAVIHAAAHVEMHGPWEQFQRHTIDGTRHLLAAVLPRRPRRFIYISSGGVYGLAARGGAPFTERTPTRPAVIDYYSRAKLQAERIVRSECARHGCPWTILRLGVLYGPGNHSMMKHLAPLAERGRLCVVGPGDNRLALLFVEDAVRAILMASSSAVAGNRIYNVAHVESVTQREFLDATTEALGLPPVLWQVRRRVALTSAWLIDLIARCTNRSFHVSQATVALFSADHVIDTDRIRADLGWSPEVSFREGMRRVREWHTRNMRG